MNPHASPPTTLSVTCQVCGAALPSIDPLGGGLCEACLWGELSRPAADGISPYRDLVPGHEIVEELGRGGMGVVYRAHQITPPREVALKMLLPLDSGQPELRARFQQEAQALAELEHPAILPLYQVGESEGLPYFTMKLAGGGTLAARLAIDGAWSARSSAELIALLADALHHAHVHGVIHRDLKPGNILFDDAGRPYLADFGLAKLEDTRATFSRSAGVLGTPAYLAPEIASFGARAATTGSDIYSLGAVLYELLTGRPPFVMEGLAALLRKIAEEEPPTPSSLNAQIPRDLEVVCLKCLHKSATDRYATAAEFAEDLRRWLRGEPVRARQFTSAERLMKWARRRPALAGLSAALALTLLGSGVWLTWTNHRLNHALERAEAAQARADQRAEFFIRNIADSLEALGRLDLLNDAYADVLVTDIGTDERTRSRRARILTRWGRSLIIQNSHHRALGPLTEAVQLAESLPPTPDQYIIHTDASAALATLVAETASFDQAMALLAAAGDRLDRAPSLPAEVRARAGAQLAGAYTEIGLVTVRSSKEIQEQAARAVAHRRRLLQLDPGPATRLALAVSLRAQGATLQREASDATAKRQPDLAKPRWEEALKCFEEALALARELTRQPKPSPAWDREEAQNIGWIAEARGALDPAFADEALAYLKLERDALQRAVANDPRDWRSRSELASALDRLAREHEKRREPDQVDAVRAAHEKLVADINRDAPASRSWMLISMNAGLELAQWHLDRQRPEMAELHFDQAWKTAERLIIMRPTHRSDQRGLMEVERMIREAWTKAKRPEKIRPVRERALAFAQSQAAAGPASHAFGWIAAHYHRRLAELSLQEGDLTGAHAHNLAAMKARADVLRAEATPALVDPDAVPNGFLESEKTHLALNQVPEAVALAREALDLRRRTSHLSLNPNPWADAVLEAARRGVDAGGATAQDARRLAARALTDLYPAAAPAGTPALAAYHPEPGDADTFHRKAAARMAELKELAGPEALLAP